MTFRFKQKELMAKFLCDGFVRVPLLTELECQSLQSFFESLPRKDLPEGGNIITWLSEKKEIREAVHQEISSFLAKNLTRYTDNFRTFCSTFVVKTAASEDGVYYPHRDWTFVDEREELSVQVWCPLRDTTFENGALGVLPGSHLRPDYLRGSPPHAFGGPLDNELSLIMEKMTFFPMKAGEALLFDPRLLHASHTNSSSEKRAVILAGITSKEAQLLHYYRVPQSEPMRVRKYEIQDDFFMKYNAMMLAELYERGELLLEDDSCRFIEEFEYQHTHLSRREVAHLIESLQTKAA